MSQPTTHFYEFGPFRLDAIKRLLLRDGEVVPLKSKDFELLLALVEGSGQALGKEDLMKRVWPDSVVEEGNLSVHIFNLRRTLGETPDDHRYIVTMPGRGYVFVASVQELRDDGAELIARERVHSNIIGEREETDRGAIENEDSSSALALGPLTKLEPVGGAAPLDSPFYIERLTDIEFKAAVARRDSIVLVKGARQVGKTSLLARSLQQAREAGARVALTDFQQLNASHLASAESLLRMLAKSLADQLELAVAPDQIWDADLGPSMNFTRYVRREALGQTPAPLVWGLDEVDRLFTCSFGSEVFGLFRSWHNARSLDPTGPWPQLTLAMAYATEAHLFITDIHQSPFNVGTRLKLEDFTLEQVAELNRRYGTPLSEAEVERYFRLVGGHPYLVRRGLHEMTARGATFDALESRAAHDEGPFSDHLRRLLISLSQDTALCRVTQGLLEGQPCPNAESFYRLRSAGVMVGESSRDIKPRCQLYADYLRQHLL
ncbi:MAG TPA: AAA-like domain-containing protein [Blastocatellia bacterium]|nr:AAA-like domain-containing protein [Blastocatellia bacterium]